MKNLEEILKSDRLAANEISKDGGNGIVYMPGWRGTVVWSYGCGWDHVSVTPEKARITPSWDDMCRLKDMFFNEDEWVVQFHPAVSEYINNMPNCLHLWKPTIEPLPTPPSFLTGTKPGQTMSDVKRLYKAECERLGVEF